MSQRYRPMPASAHGRRLLLSGVTLGLATCMVLAGCSSGVTASGSGTGLGANSASPAAADQVPATSSAMVLVDPGDPERPTRPDRPITVQVADGRLTGIVVTDDEGGALPGALSTDGTRWTSAGELLAFGGRYTVQATAVDAAGVATQVTRTVKVATPETVSATAVVREGATVGVGMPLVVRFSRPVEDRAAVERRLSVSTTPAVTGAWRWISDREVHYRPPSYWAAGTTISVKADLEGVRLGDEQWGEGRLDRTYRIGSANIYRVNVDTFQMEVWVNGSLARTMPITTGKEGFLTRNGVKVIMSKESSRRMNSETVAIPRDSAEAYDLVVQYAMRLTNSGEFIHAAPWSVASQGKANVSHGCTGMSTEDAKWLYDNSKIGDVVEYTGSPRPMTLSNGYGDWNAPWSDWLQGSALA